MLYAINPFISIPVKEICKVREFYENTKFLEKQHFSWNMHHFSMSDVLKMAFLAENLSILHYFNFNTFSWSL